jgi:hypothetical protein
VIIPAWLVAVLMTAAGLEHYRAAILGYVPEGSMSENRGTVAPGYLWPLWGVALDAATYAYRQLHEHLSRGAAVGGVGHRLGRRPPPLVAAGYRGVAGCIQVTNRTYQRLRDGYRFQRRGPIQVRGMGEMVTYFLVGRN